MIIIIVTAVETSNLTSRKKTGIDTNQIHRQHPPHETLSYWREGGPKGSRWRHDTLLLPSLGRRSPTKYEMTASADCVIDKIKCYYATRCVRLPHRNRHFERISINKFATRFLVLQRFLLRCVIFFLLGTGFNILWKGYEWSEHNGVRASAVQGIRVGKLFIGRFLTSACKVITFHLYQFNTSLPKCTGHCEL
jgi:hypothetical protein